MAGYFHISSFFPLQHRMEEKMVMLVVLLVGTAVVTGEKSERGKLTKCF